VGGWEAWQKKRQHQRSPACLAHMRKCVRNVSVCDAKASEEPCSARHAARQTCAAKHAQRNTLAAHQSIRHLRHTTDGSIMCLQHTTHDVAAWSIAHMYYITRVLHHTYTTPQMYDTTHVLDTTPHIYYTTRTTPHMYYTTHVRHHTCTTPHMYYTTHV